MKILPKIAFYDGELGWHINERGVKEWESWLVTVRFEGADEETVAPATCLTWGGYCWIDVAKQGYWPKTLYFFIHELVHWGIWLCGNFERVHKWHDSFFELIHFGKEK